MNNIPKQYLIIGVIVLVVLLAGGFFYMRNQNLAKERALQAQTQEEDVEEPIPTVDPAKVTVALEPNAGNKELTISVDGIPDGTDTIDYELSYNTVSQGFQGVIGSVEVEGDSVEKEVTLGTCSSGTCIYHEVDGPVKVTLLFSGSYGDQVFEKEFELDES